MRINNKLSVNIDYRPLKKIKNHKLAKDALNIFYKLIESNATVIPSYDTKRMEKALLLKDDTVSVVPINRTIIEFIYSFERIAKHSEDFHKAITHVMLDYPEIYDNNETLQLFHAHRRISEMFTAVLFYDIDEKKIQEVLIELKEKKVELKKIAIIVHHLNSLLKCKNSLTLLRGNTIK